MNIFRVAGQYFIGALPIQQHLDIMLAGKGVHPELGIYTGGLKGFFLVVANLFKITDQLFHGGLGAVIRYTQFAGKLADIVRFVPLEAWKRGGKCFQGFTP